MNTTLDSAARTLRKKTGAAFQIAEISLPRPLRLPGVRLAYYTGLNFGDMLSLITVQHFLKSKVRYGHYRGADILAIGSILDPLQKWGNPRKPLIWGSGLIQPGPQWRGDPIDVRAVRGHLTKSRVESCIEREIALGDPGLLVSRIFPELLGIRTRYSISIIPHIFDMGSDELADAKRINPAVHIISPKAPPYVVLEQIAASKVVLSSSLHGLICADALGIPNYWCPMSNKLEGGSYKFEDYYSIYNLAPDPLRLTTAITEDLSTARHTRIRDMIGSIQESLQDSFPTVDLQG